MVCLKSSVDEAGKHVAAEHALAPDRIELGGGLLGDRFLLARAGCFESGNLVADGRKHIVEFLKVGLRAQWSVPGDNLCVVVRHSECLLTGVNHTADRAACSFVNEWIHPIEPDVADM